MRPTKRGLTALATIALGAVLAWYAGRRALNAFVAPLVVASVAATVTVAATSRPELRRQPVAPGYVGETRSVSFTLAAGRGTLVTAVDAIGPGLESEANRFERVVSGTQTLEYDVLLRSRGVRTVGPLAVTVRDVFGLLERRYRYDATETVLVYPPVYELAPDTRAALEGYVDAANEFDRAVFEHLREYERGDSLRDVHWKSAAKRPDDDLVVKEFVAEDGFDRLSLAGTCAAGRADELAAALATLVDHVFDLDVGVILRLPGDRRIEAVPASRDTVFDELARFGPGDVSQEHRDAADIVVEATEEAVEVTFDDRTVPFADLCVTSADRAGPAAADGGSVRPSGRAPTATGGDHA